MYPCSCRASNTGVLLSVFVLCSSISFSFAGLIGEEKDLRSDPNSQLLTNGADNNPAVHHFILGVISDNDKKSASKSKPNTWESKFLRGQLLWDDATRNLTVVFDHKNTKVLSSGFNAGGRGMELSELIYYDSVLTAFDDKTGIVYKIENGDIYPWIILSSGDGKMNKGFKSEWATVKDGRLVVGSHGSTDIGQKTQRSSDQMKWIKLVSHTGAVEHVDWIENYRRLQNKTDCTGYIIHEAVCWSDVHKRWFLLPRKCSKEVNPATYDLQSSNILFIADESFDNIVVIEAGEQVPGRGFSSFKFLPDSRDSIVIALKTAEAGDKVFTYISAYSIQGEIILADTLISEKDKFEGVEFIHPYDPILNYTASEEYSTSSHSVASHTLLSWSPLMILFVIYETLK